MRFMQLVNTILLLMALFAIYLVGEISMETRNICIDAYGRTSNIERRPDAKI